MIAVLPGDLVETLLGVVVVASSALIVSSSLWTVVRRRKAEERFLSVLADSMGKTFTQDKQLLERAKNEELTEKEKEDLKKVIFGALPTLDDKTDKDLIRRALEQPSPRGRDNYEKKILSESARRALPEVEKVSTASSDRPTSENAQVGEQADRQTDDRETPLAEEGTEQTGGWMSIFPARILVATDGSEEAELALTTAADLSKSTNSELHVAYVSPVTELPREELELEEAMRQAQPFLNREVEQVEGKGVEVADIHFARGSPDQELVRISEEIDAGLIVMGSRGTGGVRRALMGSVADSVARHARAAVLIVRR